jgi:hypothetical protein
LLSKAVATSVTAGDGWHRMFSSLWSVKEKSGMVSHYIAQEKLTENAVLNTSGNGDCVLECWMI